MKLDAQLSFMAIQLKQISGFLNGMETIISLPKKTALKKARNKEDKHSIIENAIKTVDKNYSIKKTYEVLLRSVTN